MFICWYLCVLILLDDPPQAARAEAGAGAAAGDGGESGNGAVAEGLPLPSRQVFLTPVGTVVVGIVAAEAYAKAYKSRVTADQKVCLIVCRVCMLIAEMRWGRREEGG